MAMCIYMHRLIVNIVNHRRSWQERRKFFVPPKHFSISKRSRQHLIVALCRTLLSVDIMAPATETGANWHLCTQQPIPCTSRALLSVDKMAAATKARAHQHLCTLQSFCHRFCFVAFLLLLLFLLSLVPFLLDIDWRLPWQYQAWGKRPNYPTCYFDSFCHWTKKAFAPSTKKAFAPSATAAS